jgi:hypothetical protein
MKFETKYLYKIYLKARLYVSVAAHIHYRLIGTLLTVVKIMSLVVFRATH